MASAIFSKAVLLGMQKHGIKLADVVRITGMPSASLRLVLKEKARFSDSQMAAVERITDITPGEFALMSCENPDPAFIKVMKSLAAVRGPSRRSLALVKHA